MSCGFLAEVLDLENLQANARHGTIATSAGAPIPASLVVVVLLLLLLLPFQPGSGVRRLLPA